MNESANGNWSVGTAYVCALCGLGVGLDDDAPWFHAERYGHDPVLPQEDPKMTEAPKHFHVRRGTGPADGRMTVVATPFRERVAAVRRLYGEHADELEVEENCGCTALLQVDCPACKGTGVGFYDPCGLCQGSRRIAHYLAAAYEADGRDVHGPAKEREVRERVIEL